MHTNEWARPALLPQISCNSIKMRYSIKQDNSLHVKSESWCRKIPSLQAAPSDLEERLSLLRLLMSWIQSPLSDCRGLEVRQQDVRQHFLFVRKSPQPFHYQSTSKAISSDGRDFKGAFTQGYARFCRASCKTPSKHQRKDKNTWKTKEGLNTRARPTILLLQHDVKAGAWFIQWESTGWGWIWWCEPKSQVAKQFKKPRHVFKN